jgi:hypothetical protein
VNIKITSLKVKSKKLREFGHNEWNLIHPEHFGTKQDADLWKKNKFFLKRRLAGRLLVLYKGIGWQG